MNSIQRDSTIHLRHPVTGEPLIDEATGEPVTITLFMARDAAEIAAMNARARAMGWDPDTSCCELVALAILTKSWAHIFEDGQPLPCSPSNAMRVYSEHPWLFDQINAGADECDAAHRANVAGYVERRKFRRRPVGR